MNIPNDEPEFDPFAHALNKRNPSGGGVAWLALLLVLSLAGFNAWQWWAARVMDTEADTRVDEISALRQAHSELQQSLEALRTRQQVSDQRNDPAVLVSIGTEIEAVQARLSELELSEAGDEALLEAVQNAMASLHERQKGMDATVAALARRGETTDKNMDLAEVDFLLRLAGERLVLFGDVRSADQALELAQTTLTALEDPLYLTVRRRIDAARQSLAEVPELDVVEVSGRISALQSKITLIPFPGEANREADSVNEENPGVWQRIKNALTPLVKVRRRVDESTLLSLEDKDFLRQGLWLQMETARLALMRRDGSSWDLSLARAAETLEGRFDTSSPAVQQALAAINDLKALPMSVELPDISAPWTQLRLLREGQAPGRTLKPAVLPENAGNAQTHKTAEPGKTEVVRPEAGPEAHTSDDQVEDGETEEGDPGNTKTGEDKSPDDGGAGA